MHKLFEPMPKEQEQKTAPVTLYGVKETPMNGFMTFYGEGEHYCVIRRSRFNDKDKVWQSQYIAFQIGKEGGPDPDSLIGKSDDGLSKLYQGYRVNPEKEQLLIDKPVLVRVQTAPEALTLFHRIGLWRKDVYDYFLKANSDSNEKTYSVVNMTDQNLAVITTDFKQSEPMPPLMLQDLALIQPKFTTHIVETRKENHEPTVPTKTEVVNADTKDVSKDKVQAQQAQPDQMLAVPSHTKAAQVARTDTTKVASKKNSHQQKVQTTAHQQKKSSEGSKYGVGTKAGGEYAAGKIFGNEYYKELIDNIKEIGKRNITDPGVVEARTKKIEGINAVKTATETLQKTGNMQEYIKTLKSLQEPVGARVSENSVPWYVIFNVGMYRSTSDKLLNNLISDAEQLEKGMKEKEATVQRFVAQREQRHRQPHEQPKAKPPKQPSDVTQPPSSFGGGFGGF